jgi:hypothetical protein
MTFPQANSDLNQILHENVLLNKSAGFVRQKMGKPVPSFIKQRWNIDGIFLPSLLSNEPGTGSRNLY